jgi:hypothetical protein
MAQMGAPTVPAIERRLARLEAQAPTQRPTPAVCALPTLDPEAARVVLAILIEIGALIPPPPDAPDRFGDLRHALFGSDNAPADSERREANANPTSTC